MANKTTLDRVFLPALCLYGWGYTRCMCCLFGTEHVLSALEGADYEHCELLSYSLRSRLSLFEEGVQARVPRSTDPVLPRQHGRWYCGFANGSRGEVRDGLRLFSAFIREIQRSLSAIGSPRRGFFRPG